MMQDYGTYFFGFKLIAEPWMCDKVQARKHKKKRINKKWRKRYGMKEIPWTKLFITEDGKIFGHPKMIERITEEMKRKGLAG